MGNICDTWGNVYDIWGNICDTWGNVYDIWGNICDTWGNVYTVKGEIIAGLNNCVFADIWVLGQTLIAV